MIRYETIEGGVNKYAFVVYPTPEEERELMKKGYTYFSQYPVEDKENENYGKIEEMWIK